MTAEPAEGGTVDGHPGDLEPDPAEGRLTPERLLAFSDGVVAIGLTLLILPLADLVPDHAEPGASGLDLIKEHVPLIGVFLLSFLVIARFWMVHHRLFDWARHVTSSLVIWNAAWLLTIVVLPFPTEMVGTYGDDPFTVRFYVGTLFVSSALLTVMTLQVGRQFPPDHGLRRRYPASFATSGMLLLALLIVVVFPSVGYVPLLLLFASSIVEGVIARLLRWRRGRSGSS